MKIILIGFMGAGKTTVAEGLARKFGLKVVEMDEELVAHSDYKNIPEIFERKGETFFRELEQQSAKRMRDIDGVVISTGGGVVLNNLTMSYLKQNGIAVFLDTSFSQIVSRLKNTTGRPLFKDPKPAKILFDLRAPLYRYYADYVVDTNGKSIDEIVRLILTKLEAKV